MTKPSQGPLGWRSAALVGIAGTLLLSWAVVLAFAPLEVSQWVWAIVFGAPLCGAMVTWGAYALRQARPSRRLAWLAIGSALALRVLLLPAEHELSHDAARYHWDGKILVNGVNPYLHAPRDSAVAHLRGDDLDERINHAEVVTVYPPLAQALFAVAYLVTPGSLLGFQLLVLLAELLTWMLLARELERRGESSGWLFLAAWSPLLMVEGYLPGHVDLLALPFVTLFVVASRDKRPLRAGLALALACLVKPFPLILAPAAAWYLGRRGTAQLTVVMVFVVAIAYAPFIGAGSNLFSSMVLMASDWSFNGTIFHLLESVLPQSVARLLCGTSLAILILFASARRAPLEARFALCCAALAALSPFLFPWYLAFFVPLLVLYRAPALIALVGLIPLTHAVMARFLVDRTWESMSWPKAIAFGAFYSIAAWEAFHRRGMFSRGVPGRRREARA